jgi:hypothetical protein
LEGIAAVALYDMGQKERYMKWNEMFTKKEQDIIAEEMKERFLDIITMNGKSRVISILDDLEFLGNNDSITISYKLTFNVGDLSQIIGRKRRVTGVTKWIKRKLKKQ